MTSRRLSLVRSRLARVAQLLVALAVLTSTGRAQRPDMNDPDFAKAVSAILTFDHFAELCAEGKGLSAKDAAEVGTWRSTNRIDIVRARIAQLEEDAVQNARLNDARQEVLKKYGTLKLWSCRAALQATRRPEAQLAANAPRLLGALERASASAGGEMSPPSAATATPTAASTAAATSTTGSSRSSTATSAATSTPVSPSRESNGTTDARANDPARGTPASASSPARPTAPLLASIEAFGFDSRPSMGIGGFMSLAIYPIVLFRNGDALTDVTGLADPAGVDAHRRSHPDDWTRWRRQGGQLQLANERGWEAPSFQSTYSRLPDDYRLDGYFRALSGVGNIAVGGTDAVTVWRDYRFWRDGRVVRGGGSGAQAAAGDASIVTRSVAPNQRGRYRVEGLTLSITYDDGSVESYILIADPTDPTTGIWLDGEAFPRRRAP